MSIPIKSHREEYEEYWRTMIVKPEYKDAVMAIAEKLMPQRQDYLDDSQFLWECVGTRFPWQLLAAIDYREGAGERNTHFANGDPLHSRTHHVPAGLPKEGNPPFTYQQALKAAIIDFGERWNIDYKTLVWDVPTMLCFAESWNGFGSRAHLKEPFGSPYLWSFTFRYESGYFTGDGKWDGSMVNKTCGIAPILWYLGVN